MGLAELRRLCAQHTDLNHDDIDVLAAAAAQLPLLADLLGTDIFIDCLTAAGDSAIIVAEAHPETGSLYKQPTIGKIALPENEPAVFYTFRDGIVFRGLRAVTQENIAVRQDVAPIVNQGRMIGVLIREKDISASINRSRKYDSLLQTNLRLQEAVDMREEAVCGDDNLAAREMSHRIKNNLQMLAGILNLEARRVSDPALRGILAQAMSRVLTFSDLHAMLSEQTSNGTLELKSFLQRLLKQLAACFAADGRIEVALTGDMLELPADQTVSLALVVNELVSNAYLHAFPPEEKGCIEVILQDTPLRRIITVKDDGRGPSNITPGLGLHIAESTLRDKLQGYLSLCPGELGGTMAIIEF